MSPNLHGSTLAVSCPRQRIIQTSLTNRLPRPHIARYKQSSFVGSPRDLAKVVIPRAFVFDGEFKFKSHLRLEFLQIEIPDTHFICIGERLPNPRYRRVESSFNYDRFGQISLCCSHIFVLL